MAGFCRDAFLHRQHRLTGDSASGSMTAFGPFDLLYHISRNLQLIYTENPSPFRAVLLNMLRKMFPDEPNRLKTMRLIHTPRIFVNTPRCASAQRGVHI